MATVSRTKVPWASVFIYTGFTVLLVVIPYFTMHGNAGTGTPEAGGLTSRELLGILRGLAGLRLVGADVVEVAPAYDHAEMTTVAAAHVAYELLALMLLGR